jgi:hypothetical protein
MLHKVLHDTGCDFDLGLAWCVNAKNSLNNVQGFSSFQLSIGQNPRLPTVLSNRPPAYDSSLSSKLIRDNLNALHCARQAFIESERSERIARALSHNIRTSNDVKYSCGDSVYYKRDKACQWKGPGTVIGQDGQQVLVKHGATYVRVHPCRLMLKGVDSQITKSIVNDVSKESNPSPNTDIDISHESDEENPSSLTDIDISNESDDDNDENDENNHS